MNQEKNRAYLARKIMGWDVSDIDRRNISDEPACQYWEDGKFVINGCDYKPDKKVRQFFDLLDKFCNKHEYFFGLDRDVQGTYDFTIGRFETMADGGTYGADLYVITAPSLKKLMPKVVEAICKWRHGV